MGEANPLTGLVYCADCGRRMYNSRNNPCEITDKRTDKKRTLKARNSYSCSLYQIHIEDCTMHHIKTEHLRAIVLETIQGATAYARNNEAEFIEVIRAASDIRQSETAKNHQRQISKNEKRIAELDTLFKKTYEDFAAGRLNEKRFNLLSQGYEEEQAQLEQQTAEMQTALEQYDNDGLRADKFLELAKRWHEFDELTAPMLHEFVDKIIVHEADKSSGKRVQDVEIVLNYIGQFAIPCGAEVEVEADTEDDAKRAMWREYKRNQRAKAKQTTAKPKQVRKERKAI